MSFPVRYIVAITSSKEIFRVSKRNREMFTALMARIRAEVQEKYGVLLEPEVRIL